MENASGGTQSIQRAAMILRHIGNGHDEGVRLVDLSNELYLERPTVHRIVKSLMAENLVTQDVTTRRYHLGQGIVALSLIVNRKLNFQQLAQPLLEDMARQTGDTFYLNQRIGNEALCLIRTDGHCPIKIYSVGVGDRRPLGVGAGGLAMLSEMPVAERNACIAANEQALSKYKGLNKRALLRLIEKTKTLGYAHLDVYGLAGVHAVGVPIMSPQGAPVAALSIASISNRLGTKRVEELVVLLRKNARQLEQLISDYHW
ncbi:IclR family transcriptional regulator [Hydrogenophaga sp. BPS33]|uniref:IclR family transcriptional regulator n=1 Tax=Hydrogenophaga sp. BPS33 TaxID=2651974 RepID=UPI0013595E15|nr:IclR family transcriptional regulator [Hydrogenophaga sp. BPS33]